MGKLITITEAANILGVSRQNLTNWGEQGIIRLRRMGKSNASLWANRADVEALGEPMKEISYSKSLLEQELKETQEKERIARNTLRDIERQIKLTRRFSHMVICTDFDRNFIETMRILGKICDREAMIMKGMVRGDDIDCIASDLYLSRARVMQIFFKGCKKCGDTYDIKERLDEAQKMKEEMTELRNAMRLVQEENDQLREQLGMPTMTDDERESNEIEGICTLFNKNVLECGFSVRAMNCLKAADIKTVGELCKYNMNELLKFRNFGRKSLTELEDFLEMMGLSFSMDVDSYYKKRLRMKAYDTTDNDR